MKPNLTTFRQFCIYFSLICLIGCSIFYSKENYLKDFKSFIAELKENYSEYSESDWSSADKQYIEFTEVLYEKFKNEFSSEEKMEVNKLKGAYVTLKLNKNIKDMIEQGTGLIEGAIETITN